MKEGVAGREVREGGDHAIVLSSVALPLQGLLSARDEWEPCEQCNYFPP